jgi:hypothetical protein
MENTKDNTNIWIDIDKASEMIGLSSQTLKRKCRKGEFVFKIVKKGKVAHYFVLLKSMPDFAQDKYLGDSAVDLKYSEVPSWAKLQAEKYVRIIDASAGLKGKELKEFILKNATLKNESKKLSEVYVKWNKMYMMSRSKIFTESGLENFQVYY